MVLCSVHTVHLHTWSEPAHFLYRQMCLSINLISWSRESHFPERISHMEHEEMHGLHHDHCKYQVVVEYKEQGVQRPHVHHSQPCASGQSRFINRSVKHFCLFNPDLLGTYRTHLARGLFITMCNWTKANSHQSLAHRTPEMFYGVVSWISGSKGTNYEHVEVCITPESGINEAVKQWGSIPIRPTFSHQSENRLSRKLDNW